jgi:4a-hydroxytetrahydrobiopterin dehydratase
MKLDELKCAACTGKTPKLNEEDINIYLNKLKNWQINDERELIFKKIKFKTFKQALVFTNLIGEIAEKEGHHPDISLGYGYCLILIHTHAIKGLSMNDFILAAKIDQISI